MNNEKERVSETIVDDKKPISDKELYEIMTDIKKKAKREDHLYIVKADLEYGLSKEDVEIYAYLNTKNKKFIKFISEVLRKTNGKPLAKYLAENSFTLEQMDVISKFYFKGMNLSDIKEAMTEEQTAYSLNDALEKVFERLYEATEKSVDESESVQALQEQINSVVSNIGENNQLMKQLMTAVNSAKTAMDVDAIRQEYVERIEQQDQMIEELRTRNESLSRDNAVLRQSKEDVRTITEEIAELKVQVTVLKKERDEALASVEVIRKEKETMQRKMDSVRTEMDAVKNQIETAKSNPVSVNKTENMTRKAVVDRTVKSDYQISIGTSSMMVDRAKPKGVEGLVLKAGRILKGVGKPNVLHAMAETGMTSEQMSMIGMAMQKGLTNAEAIDIISCGFDTDEMEQAIDIVLMEKNY